MRWLIGLIVSFILVFAVNIFAAWLAVSDPPTVVESYADEATR